jgi:hypothetical protein
MVRILNLPLTTIFFPLIRANPFAFNDGKGSWLDLRPSQFDVGLPFASLLSFTSLR